MPTARRFGSTLRPDAAQITAERLPGRQAYPGTIAHSPSASTAPRCQTRASIAASTTRREALLSGRRGHADAGISV